MFIFNGINFKVLKYFLEILLAIYQLRNIFIYNIILFLKIILAIKNI